MDLCSQKHTAQDLFKDYKDNICLYCANKNSLDCDIHINGNITVICENYKKCDK